MEGYFSVKVLSIKHFVLFQIGFVNWLEFTSDGKYLIAAISQEHRLGRWWRIKEARNEIHSIPLCTIDSSQ